MSPREFIKKTFTFIAIFIVLNAFMNALYFELMFSKTLRSIGEAQFQETKSDVSILVMGDSLPRASVIPSRLKDSFNFSSAGENYIQTYYKLLYYLEKESLDIELVILPLDLHSFSSFQSDRFLNPYYWKKYINYVELGQTKGDLPTYISQRIQGEFGYFAGLDDTLSLLTSPPIKDQQLELGFKFLYGDFSQVSHPVEFARRRANLYFKRHNYLDPDLLEYFLRLLALCRKHNIEVVLVKYPVTYEYYNEASKLISIDEYSIRLNTILGDPSPSPILDYQNIFWGSNQLFNDSNHLNFSGAVRFTEILVEDLRTLRLIP